jgi:YebC/PmpR family DNA-binding regulatory protein
MAGHSKWASIKHKKKIEDTKRGKIFSKLIKEITVAARLGGGDIEGNPRLRLAVQRAKDANMPSENITKAIKRGTGELGGERYEEYIYEGYGPGGVAVMVTVATDNKNRTASEIRNIFSRNGGSIGEAHCVEWLFTRKGYFRIDKKCVTEDELISIALESGAEDVLSSDEDEYEIISSPEAFEKVKEKLIAHQIPVNIAEVTMLPKNVVKLEGRKAEQMLNMMEALEEHDDVQHVYANFDIPKEMIEGAAK